MGEWCGERGDAITLTGRIIGSVTLDDDFMKDAEVVTICGKFGKARVAVWDHGAVTFRIVPNKGESDGRDV